MEAVPLQHYSKVANNSVHAKLFSKLVNTNPRGKLITSKINMCNFFLAERRCSAVGSGVGWCKDAFRRHCTGKAVKKRVKKSFVLLSKSCLYILQKHPAHPVPSAPCCCCWVDFGCHVRCHLAHPHSHTIQNRVLKVLCTTSFLCVCVCRKLSSRAFVSCGSRTAGGTCSVPCKGFRSCTGFRAGFFFSISKILIT